MFIGSELRVLSAIGGFLKDHDPVPVGRVRIAKRLLVEDQAVVMGACFDEIFRRPMHFLDIRVIDQDEAVFREERLGNLEAFELMLVTVVAIIDVKPDGSLVALAEIFLIIHFMEVMTGAFMGVEYLEELVFRAAELGKIVDTDALFLLNAIQAGNEREAMPEPDVHEGLVLG